jgi:hypothetical protein
MSNEHDDVADSEATGAANRPAGWTSILAVSNQPRKIHKFFWTSRPARAQTAGMIEAMLSALALIPSVPELFLIAVRVVAALYAAATGAVGGYWVEALAPSLSARTMPKRPQRPKSSAQRRKRPTGRKGG